MESWTVGILSFEGVERLLGREVADRTAHHIEHGRDPGPGRRG